MSVFQWLNGLNGEIGVPATNHVGEHGRGHASNLQRMLAVIVRETRLKRRFALVVIVVSECCILCLSKNWYQFHSFDDGEWCQLLTNSCCLTVFQLVNGQNGKVGVSAQNHVRWQEGEHAYYLINVPLGPNVRERRRWKPKIVTAVNAVSGSCVFSFLKFDSVPFRWI